MRTQSPDQDLAETILSQFARGSFSARDPDAVLAPGERPAVEPAVALENLEARLAEAGFEVLECYGWFDRRPFAGGEDSVWIARRK